MKNGRIILAVAVLAIGTLAVFSFAARDVFAQKSLPDGTKIDISTEVYQEMEKMGEEVYITFGRLG